MISMVDVNKEKIHVLKERLKNRKASKNYASAADTATDLAAIYADENDNENALVYYKDALACIAKVQHEFVAHRGCLESTYEEPQAKILNALNSFMEYVKRLKDPSHKQIALHVSAYTYQQYLKGEEDYLEKAKGFALDSLEMLRQDGAKIDEILKNRYTNAKKLEDDDSKRRLAEAYQLLASICDEEGNTKAAEVYINKALAFERLESDPIFYHTILSIKLKYVSRERKYEISSKMLELVEKIAEKSKAEKCMNKYHDENLLETQSFFAKDCLSQKDLENAAKYYWKIYNNEKNIDRGDFKKEAKGQLIKLYKIKERTKEVIKFEEVQKKDYRKLSKMYEKIADEMFKAHALECALDYYKKMYAAGKLLPGDSKYGDLEIARAALISVADTYNDLLQYEEAVKHFEKLLIVESRLGCPDAVLADTRLNIAIAKIYCKSSTFEQQKSAFENVKMPNDKTVLYIKYLEKYIELLEKYKNKENVSSLLNDLNIEFKNYKQIKSVSQDVPGEPSIKTSQNDCYV
uniref:Uncharacterized protein n=1 Tax=Panagrolaimus davidi TaxID=227884 RepID=A0A914QUM6_9BILA